MKKVFSLIVLFFLITAFAFTKTNDESKMQSFKWLEGSWVMKKKNGSSVMESWFPHNDSTMLGESMSFSITGQSKVLENLELAYQKGSYYYISKVNGQNNGEAISF